MASAEYFGGFFWNVCSRLLCKESSLEGFKGGGGGCLGGICNLSLLYIQNVMLFVHPYRNKTPFIA